MTIYFNSNVVKKLTPEDIKQAISRKLAECRAEKRCSCEDVSVATNLSPAKIRSLESGCQSHSWGQYQRLLDFYHKEVKITISLINKQ